LNELLLLLLNYAKALLTIKIILDAYGAIKKISLLYNYVAKKYNKNTIIKLVGICQFQIH